MPRPYQEVLLEAVERSGRSARDVSISAVGHESAIRSVRRGLDLRVSTVEGLCRELGLELHVGPPQARDVPSALGGAELQKLVDAIVKTYLRASTNAHREVLLVSLRTLRDSLDDWIAGRPQIVEEDEEVVGPPRDGPTPDAWDED